LGRLGRG
jgi:hypothetical protein